MAGGSASAGGSDVVGQNPTWKYYTPLEGNKNGTTCNYSSLIIKMTKLFWILPIKYISSFKYQKVS